jgi:hypothetical protein
MNTYIKYSPLFYTYNTRINRDWILTYLYINILFWIVSIILSFNYIHITLIEVIISFLLFFFVFISYIIFYEIWYIFNDLITTKYEKKPTLRITEKLNIFFISINIITRLLYTLIFTYWLYVYYENNIATIYVSLLLWTFFAYSIHNLSRNIFITFHSFFILRLLKFSVVLIPITFISQWLLKNTELLLILLLFFWLLQFSISMEVQSKKEASINTISYYKYCYISLFWLIISVINPYSIIYYIYFLLLFFKTNTQIKWK